MRAHTRTHIYIPKTAARALSIYRKETAKTASRKKTDGVPLSGVWGCFDYWEK